MKRSGQEVRHGNLELLTVLKQCNVAGERLTVITPFLGSQKLHALKSAQKSIKLGIAPGTRSPNEKVFNSS